MLVKRVLADCVVLSLQDSSVFYPSCRGCFSRIDVEQPDGTRCRCCKCGYSCSRELVDYRYRLSVWATRDGCIFGITVFGTCLNPFFGIHASGLKRLLENLDGPIDASTRSTVLLKAVEDCFIGRHFTFGIKLSDTERMPWVGVAATKGSRSAEKIQVIASQMIPPKAPVLGGCTVVSYYQILLQKAAECEVGFAESSKLCGPQHTAPLLIRHHAEAGSLEHDASGFCRLSLQRTPMHQDSTLSPTPPFQQSLGLVTSSAEQECCSNQDSVDQDSSQRGEFHTPRPLRSRGPEDLSHTESLLTPLSFSSPLADRYSHVAFEGESGKPPSINSCTNLSPAGHISKATGFSSRELDETSLADSVAWEDLPFSESLSKFLFEENMVCNVSKTEQKVNVQNQVETPKNNSKLISRERHFTSKSALLPRRQTQMAVRRSQTLLNITNTRHIADDHHELPGHACRNAVRSVTRRQSRNFTFEEHHLEDAKTSLLSYDGEKEEAFGRDSYNFSADLFSSSLVNNITTNAHTETVRTSFAVLPAAGQKSPEGETMRESFMPADSQDLDFVPPSQSTPIVKAAVAPGCSYRPNRFGHCFTPKRSLRKVGGDKNQQLIRQHVGARIDSPSVASTQKIRHQCDSGSSDLTVCGDEDSRGGIFPPTPVAKTKQIRKDQMRARIDDNSVSLGQPKHRVPGKRVRLNQTPSASQTQPGSCESGATLKGGLEGWNDDSSVCNYSRDLFSDSE
ncbi:uncharacterized protein ddias [Nelusetta ayraudi]|uniref:uncharacterized protein ddias n=1 Tax=Nelusetta ayraudi TaxID=303726 RepID=UPI003F706CDA